jgi:hypothetical protein
VKSFAVAFTALLAYSSPAAAQVILDAQPSVRVESSDAGTTHTLLSDAASAGNRATVIKRGERFYWATRENRELQHVRAGAFHYFIASGGAGYIKVFDAQSLPPSQRASERRYQYMEHLTIGLSTITDWGTADDANLP